MRLTLGARSYDLATRALVLGVADAPGADLVEGPVGGGAAAVPVCTAAAGEAAVRAALAAGASLVRLPAPTAGELALCAAAGAAVIVPLAAGGLAATAGLSPDQVVPDPLFLDVTGTPCPTAATAVGVVRGARIVRTADVRGARRIVDVLAAVLETT